MSIGWCVVFCVAITIRHLQHLANEYMSTIIDKDVQIDHLKKVLKVLGSRVQQLETAFEATGAQIPAATPVPDSHEKR
jgi:hypothetical protein